MNEDLFKKIADYLIKFVQEESILTGFQYVIDYEFIQEDFGIEIEKYIQDKILEATNNREEVAEIFCDTDGYDVTLYTDYAPNYIKEYGEE